MQHDHTVRKRKFPCILIIIMSRSSHGFPWPSLVTRLYRPSVPEDPPGYILYRYKAVVDNFELVVLLLLVHVKVSTGVHRL